MLLQKEREQVVEYGMKLVDSGLVVGTFGNISVYNPEKNLMAISPSGMDYHLTTAADIVIMTPDAKIIDGNNKPSSEMDLHRIFYQKRPGIHSVIHTHSSYATTLACLHWSIEPIHYIIAYGGADIPCTPYVKIGSYELAQAAFDAMGADRYACLLGNHGLVACGSSISYAFDIAQQIEFVSQIYYRTRVAGGGVCLDDADMEGILHSFSSYRQR